MEIKQLKRRWQNFIVSGLHVKNIDFEQYREITKLKFINVLLLIGLLISLTGLIIQITNKKFDTLQFYAITPISFSIIIFLLRKYPRIKIGSFFLLTFFIISIFFGIYSGGFPKISLLFIFAYPAIAFYLQGRRNGVLWILIYSTVFLSAALLIHLRVLSSPYQTPLLIFGLINILVVSIFTYLNADRHKKTEDLMRRQIYFNPLTGLPNRKKLIKDIAESHSPVLFLINVDDFKEINAIFGYRIGDSVLIFLAKLLSHILPEYTRGVYKLAGDEFAVLIDIAEKGITKKMLTNNVTLLSHYVQREKYGYAKYEIMLRITTGIALAKNVGKENLFSCADIALKTAKQSRKQFLFYEDAEKTRSRFRENLKWLKILSNAIEYDRIFPYYQPIITNATGEIEHYECLARIIDQDGKIILPHFFLDIAKKSRLYPKITRAMLKKTFEAFKNTHDEFSINLSVEDFYDPYTLQYIKIALSESPSVKNRVTFEILESEGIENFEEFSKFIRDMKKLGCKIAIDDFGTGYSNFEYLIKLNLDYLKIAGSLIEKLDSDNGSRIIVENIVNFSKKLCIKTVAEYVHSNKIYSIVKGLGIDYSQGFLLGKPKPAVLASRRLHDG